MFVGFDANQIPCGQPYLSQTYGFNNANFDNFIFLNALLKYCETNDDISVSNIFYNGSQLLNFYIAGRHNFFDIHKHLMGSLNNNCKSFKIKCCAKKSFDHNLAQQLYDNGKLIDYINNNDELKEYNEYDVLATAVLFCKYRQALAIIPATKKYSETLDEMKTIGSLIYKVFSDSKDIKKFNLPKRPSLLFIVLLTHSFKFIDKEKYNTSN